MQPFNNQGYSASIFDTHASDLAALRDTLALNGFDTLGFSNSRELISSITLSQPDCIVVDIRGDHEADMQILRDVRRSCSASVVIIVGYELPIQVGITAMRCRADDVIEKPFPTDVLLTRIRSELAKKSTRAGSGEERLTMRERDVFRLISTGSTNKEIGRQLGISPRTIEVHRAQILRKFGAKNCADLMRIALTPLTATSAATGI